MRYMYRVKKILRIILLAVLFGIVYSFFFSVYENIKVNNVITTFIARATDTPTEIKEAYLPNGETYIKKYFEVPRETINEQDNKNIFLDDDKTNIGQKGDIFVTQQSPFPNVFGFHQFMSYYFGGHAAIKYDDTRFVEATGFPDFDNESLLSIIFSKGEKGHGFTPTASLATGYWMTPSRGSDYFDYFYRSKYIGLRPVNPFIGQEDAEENYDIFIDKALENAVTRIENEALYNFLFFLDMNRKYYCTDFVSRMYEDAYQNVVNSKLEYRNKGYAKKFNDDGFITSVNDLILTKDTYLTFYVEVKEEKYLGETKIVENIYYLEDVKVD